MNYALDLVFLFVLVLFTVLGVRRGFIRTAARFLGSVLSAVLAALLGGVAAAWLYNALFRDALVEKISSSLLQMGAGNAAIAVDELFSSLPDFLVRALKEAGVTADAIAGTLGTKTGEAAELIADSLAPVFIGFLKVLAVVVLFMLFMLIVRAVSDLLGGVLQLPLLGQIDGMLGGVFGFLLAVVTVWVLLASVQVFLPMLEEGARQKLTGALDRSILAGVLVKLNPLGILFQV